MPDVRGPPDEAVPGVHALTAKQREAAEAALRAGFFARPQRATAEEVAADLGISRSTFLHHLRNAEQVIFEHVFGTDRRSESA